MGLIKNNLYLLFTITILIISCKKNSSNDYEKPLIELTNFNNGIIGDTAISPGTTIFFNIIIKGTNSNITYINISKNNGSLYSILDTGTNSPSVNIIKEITKDNSDREIWTILAMDRNRNKNSLSISIYKITSQYKSIKTINNIDIGAQQCSLGSFYSIDSNKVFFLMDAYNNQSIIDIIYYYTNNSSVLSSPAENDAPTIYTGNNGIYQWSIRNETRYCNTTLSITDFNNINNDSLLISSYKQEQSKRKAKDLKSNNIISFKTHNNKLGLIKINSIDPSETGKINIDIKIQQ